MKKLLYIIMLILLISCAGIKPIGTIDRTELYSSEFLISVKSITAMIDENNLIEAEEDLRKMDEVDLSENEKSLKRYLLGRLYLGNNDIEKAIYNFEIALSGAGEDQILISQSMLGLSIGYFKMGIYDRVIDNISKINFSYFNPNEKLNGYTIGHQVAKALQNQELYELSLIGLVELQSEGSSKGEKDYYKELLATLSSKNLDQQKNISLDLIKKENLLLTKIVLSLVDNFIYSGRINDAKDLILALQNSKLADTYRNQILELSSKLVDDEKVEPMKIGVILPLSGKYKKYGVQALYGIQAAYNHFLKEKLYELKIRDSKSSPIVSSYLARELYEKEKVGLIIGGLSSSEAKSTFQELRKKQIPFISLSQIFISREFKNKNLIELIPSIESEVAEVISESNLNRLGRNGSIIYPYDEAGELYLKEFYDQGLNKFKLVEAIGYQTNEEDFRDPVRQLLNLKYRKLRQNEYDLMKAYYESQKDSSVRRVQVLEPEINFDWVFIPSRPLEAIQLLPGFNYYDAFNTLMIGPASWNNSKIKELSRKNKKLHFIDEKSLEAENILEASFEENFGKKPNKISLRAMDAVGVAVQILPETLVTNRKEYIQKLNTIDNISYHQHVWKSDKNIWIKELEIYHLSRGNPREGIKN